MNYFTKIIFAMTFSSITAFAQNFHVAFNELASGLTQLPKQVSGIIELNQNQKFLKGEVKIYLNGVLTCSLKAKKEASTRASFQSKKIMFQNKIEKDECDAVITNTGSIREIIARTSLSIIEDKTQLKKVEQEYSFPVNIQGFQSLNLTPCTLSSLQRPIISANGSAVITNKENILRFVSMINNKRSADITLTAQNIGSAKSAFAQPYFGLAVNGVFLKKDAVRDLSFFERNSNSSIQDSRIDPFIGLNKGPAGRMRVYIRRIPSESLHEELKEIVVETALAANSLIDADEKKICFDEVITAPVTLNIQK